MFLPLVIELLQPKKFVFSDGFHLIPILISTRKILVTFSCDESPVDASKACATWALPYAPQDTVFPLLVS